jgi:hypothetical protein
VAEVSPPQACVEIHPFVAPQSQAGLTVVDPREAGVLDDDLHQRLLRESLSRHRNLWRSLAER